MQGHSRNIVDCAEPFEMLFQFPMQGHSRNSLLGLLDPLRQVSIPHAGAFSQLVPFFYQYIQVVVKS